MARRKKSLGKVQCLRSDGKFLGERTLVQWCEQLGINYRTAWNGFDRQGWVKGAGGMRYKFTAEPRDDDEETKPAPLPIYEAVEVARAEHKSYGKLMAEMWLENQAKAPETDAEETPDMPCPVGKEEAAECPAQKEELDIECPVMEESNMNEITLRQFANLIDGECTMNIERNSEDGPIWLMTIPAESPVLTTVIGEWPVVSFSLTEGESSLNVVVVMEGKR